MKQKYIFLDEICGSDYEKTYRLMDFNRKAKIDRLMSDADKKRSLAGEYLAKTLLAETLKIEFEAVELLQDEKGKPYVPQEGPWVSISHSENMAVAAVAQNPVGVDVEKIRSVSGKLAKRICFDNELEYIFGTLPSENTLKEDISGEMLHRFFEIWTLKEACFKCFGSPSGVFSDINALDNTFKSYKKEISDYLITVVTDR